MSELARHHDDPDGQRHRLTVVGPGRLKCHDCRRHVLVTDAAPVVLTPSPPALHAPDRCPDHPGQRAGTCGPCRAEQLEAQRTPDPRPTADHAIGAAAARAALAAITARRRVTDPEETL
jgi:hypothetical protein